MPDLGRKYTCYSCHTKFYDLGKPVPLCPKCGADQRDAEEAPVYTPSRSRRVAPVEEAPEEDEFTPAASSGGESSEGGEEEEDLIPTRDEEPEEEEEEEEY